MIIRAILLLVLLTSPAWTQQRILTDQFGRTVTVSADGKTYTVTSLDGFSATITNAVNPMDTINNMAPAGYQPPTVVVTVIKRSEFLDRFTTVEKVAISATARTNDSINVWLITAQAHDVIDLLDPLTKQGLDALVAAGIITAAREAVILTP